jgi:hypothetical protein
MYRIDMYRYESNTNSKNEEHYPRQSTTQQQQNV